MRFKIKKKSIWSYTCVSTSPFRILGMPKFSKFFGSWASKLLNCPSRRRLIDQSDFSICLKFSGIGQRFAVCGLESIEFYRKKNEEKRTNHEILRVIIPGVSWIWSRISEAAFLAISSVTERFRIVFSICLITHYSHRHVSFSPVSSPTPMSFFFASERELHIRRHPSYLNFRRFSINFS